MPTTTETSADTDDGCGGFTAIGKRGQPLRNNDNKLSGRKKLTLPPELRQRLPFGSISNAQCSYRFMGLNNCLEYFKNNMMTLEDTMERITKNILAERKHFQNVADNLNCQVVQLEEDNYLKTVKIENLQLYNSEKLKIIDSLTEVLNETIWKRDTIQRIWEEHAPLKSCKNILLVSCAIDEISVLKSIQMKLQSWLNSKEKRPKKLVDTVKQLKSSLDECINVIDRVTSSELSDDNDFDATINNFIYELENCQSSVSLMDCSSAVGLLNTVQDCKHDLENLIEIWKVVNDVFQRNQYLLNRVNSLNMHKMGLQLQLEEMETNIEVLKLKTMTEMKEVEKKEEMLSLNESLIQQHWDELDTSQEIVVQTQRALAIDQELEELQIECDTHDEENRRLKTDLSHLKNELSEYKLKCEQLERENEQIEKNKNDVLEAYAKSWGHYNVKQKIKYTGKLIKDIDKINQEIKSLELECEKLECNNVNSIVKTPVFSKTQPKSEKTTPREFGVIDTNKRPTTGILRASVVRNLWYLP